MKTKWVKVEQNYTCENHIPLLCWIITQTQMKTRCETYPFEAIKRLLELATYINHKVGSFSCSYWPKFFT